MKSYFKSLLKITFLFICSNIFVACNNSNPTKTIEKSISIARQAKDYTSLTGFLTQLYATDSVKHVWAADTLAYYHYINAFSSNEIGELNASKFFVTNGLKVNPKNKLLRILESQIDLADGKDTAAFEKINSLIKDFPGAEMEFYLASPLLAKNKLAELSQLIEKNTDANAEKTTIPLQNLMSRNWDLVNVKAAFLFVKANLVIRTEANQLNAAKQAMDLCQQALAISPKFSQAQSLALSIQQSLAQAGYR